MNETKHKRSKVTRLGYVLHETADIAVIATLKTANRKTGKMVQVWILNRNVNPVEAIKTGQDATICFDCIYRGNGIDGTDRKCYVNAGQAPNSIYKAYHRGKYPALTPTDYKAIFTGKKVRWGAYGDPVLIPLDIIREISAIADGHTGYSHQWRKPEYAGYREYLMASIDAESQIAEAEALDWSTFRPRKPWEALLPSEISCPASKEAGNKLTCSQCLRCSGRPADKPVRKSVSLIEHGSVAEKHNKLIQILPLAA